MYSWASSRIPLTLYDIQGAVADTLHRQPAKSQNNWKHDLFFYITLLLQHEFSFIEAMFIYCLAIANSRPPRVEKWKKNEWLNKFLSYPLIFYLFPCSSFRCVFTAWWIGDSILCMLLSSLSSSSRQLITSCLHDNSRYVK